ncbi:hypothetical protein ACOME3_002107 [Neoechinorhynchus agilis]
MTSYIGRLKDYILSSLFVLSSSQSGMNQSELDSALIDACQKENLAQVIKLLSQGADPTACDDDHYHPMLIAALRNNLEIAKALIANGAVVDQKGCYGRNALMAAAQCGNLDFVKLLTESKADVNAVDDESNTPLILATNSEQTNVIINLIKSGADIHKKGFERHSSLEIARKKNMREIVKLMERTSPMPSSASEPIMSLDRHSNEERGNSKSVTSGDSDEVKFSVDPDDRHRALAKAQSVDCADLPSLAIDSTKTETAIKEEVANESENETGTADEKKEPNEGATGE